MQILNPTTHGFQSTPPVKAATLKLPQGFRRTRFQSTPPVKAATCDSTGDEPEQWISIHAAREGGDTPIDMVAAADLLFQSTPPVKAATIAGNCFDDKQIISIHAAREGGDPVRQVLAHKEDISIHAAREGGDCGNE